MRRSKRPVILSVMDKRLLFELGLSKIKKQENNFYLLLFKINYLAIKIEGMFNVLY